jgi:hypothetical protein
MWRIASTSFVKVIHQCNTDSISFNLVKDDQFYHSFFGQNEEMTQIKYQEVIKILFQQTQENVARSEPLAKL